MHGNDIVHVFMTGNLGYEGSTPSTRTNLSNSAMKKSQQEKPAIRPKKEVCEKCINHKICLAEAGENNYTCIEHR